MDDPSDERRRPNRLPVRPDWLALRTEEIIRPDLPIVDPHHHLWDHAGNRYLFHEFLDDLNSGHDIHATVYVQAHGFYRAEGDPDFQVVGETEFVNGVAAMSASGQYGAARMCAGIVGYADLDLGSRVKRVLEAHLAAGGGHFRGIRDPVNSHPDPAARGSGNERPHRLLDKTFREGFACLAPLGLSFDGWLYHTQLRELGDLAGAFPGTTIIANHVGCPLGIGPYAGRRDEVLSEWRGAIREIARHPNIMMKLGGLGMKVMGFTFHEKPLPPTSEVLAQAWKPYVETCIEAFGPARCMFESNAPVDRGSCSYQILWNAFKRLAAGYSADEQTALFSGTAKRVYRLN
jgi:predicted TIM-barrel fold metal-dependent hydrolase